MLAIGKKYAALPDDELIEKARIGLAALRAKGKPAVQTPLLSASPQIEDREVGGIDFGTVNK
jgi:hypothetical protein